MSVSSSPKRYRKRLSGASFRKMAVIIPFTLLCAGTAWYFYVVHQNEVVFSHLFYIPVTLAGFWWGRKGLWVAVFLGSSLIVSHDTVIVVFVSPCHERYGPFSRGIFR